MAVPVVMFLFLCVAAFSLKQVSTLRTNYDVLTSHVLTNSDPAVVPVDVHGSPVEVTVTLGLINIGDVFPRQNEVELVVWLGLDWADRDLAWDRSEYNISRVRVPANLLWTPDITLYSLARKPEEITPPLVVIDGDGDITYVSEQRMRVLCDVQGFDTREGATCRLKFSSWTYDGQVVALRDVTRVDFDLSQYFANSPFEVLETQASRQVETDPCCYHDVIYTFRFRSRQNRMSNYRNL